MGFMEAIKHVFRNYATFQGRARRSEFWYFSLFNLMVEAVVFTLVISFGLTSAVNADNSGVFSGFMALTSIIYILWGVYSLGIIIPSLAVLARRLHDVGKSGAFMLFILIPIIGPIMLLVWELQDSMPGDNQYGPNPKNVYGQPYAARNAGYTAPAAPVFPQQNPYGAQPGQGFAPQPGRGFVPQRGGDTVFVQQSPYSLQGLSGRYAGRRFPVGGRLRIGRSPDCQICFPDGTGGVSRQHCELWVQNGQLYIRDLGSSYGTYVNGNHRLQPNQPVLLNAGDRVFIASNAQAFAVVR